MNDYMEIISCLLRKVEDDNHPGSYIYMAGDWIKSEHTDIDEALKKSKAVALKPVTSVPTVIAVFSDPLTIITCVQMLPAWLLSKCTGQQARDLLCVLNKNTALPLYTNVPDGYLKDVGVPIYDGEPID